MRRWLERQRCLIDYAVSSLRRRIGRTALLLAVFSGLVFALASVVFFGSAIRREAAVVLASAPDLVAQRMRVGRHDFARESDIEALRRLRGVDRIEGRLWGYVYDTSSAATYTVQTPSVHSGLTVAVGEAIVGEGVARLRRLQTGRLLFLVSPAGKLMKLKVASIMPFESALATTDLVLVNEADFRSFFDLEPGLYTDVAMRVRNRAEVDTAAQKAIVLLPTYRFVSRDAMARSYESLFSWREGLLLAMFVGAGFAFAILAFDKASGLSAQERREIGVLKAIGWETRDVLRMKLWEGALIAATAFAIGALAAYAHVFVFSGALFAPVLKGWSTLYPAFALTPTVDALQLSTLALLTIAPYVAAILPPVWRAASSDPDSVMR